MSKDKDAKKPKKIAPETNVVAVSTNRLSCHPLERQKQVTQSNSRGSSRETGTLLTFDQLPRSVRVALRDANRDYNVVSLLEKFRSGAMSAKALVKYIEQRDVEVTKQQSAELWGVDYPVDLIKSGL